MEISVTLHFYGMNFNNSHIPERDVRNMIEMKDIFS